MKKEKQLHVLSILKSKYYKVINGETHYLCKSTGKYIKMSPCKLPTGYSQLILWDRKNNNREVVYTHIISYLSEYGEYEEGLEIDHIDRNKQNIHPSNLRAITSKKNKTSERWIKKERTTFKCIRAKEISSIKKLMLQGLNQSQISKSLELNRLSVRLTMKKINSGEKLKYE